MVKTALGNIYSSHHKSHRGDGFVLMGSERGRFLSSVIGTDKKVLDVGCRDGALTKYFVKDNTVVGADIDELALTRAEKDLGIRIKHVDLNGDWGFEEGSFDAVVAAEILEHLYYPDKVIQKIAKVLVQDGVFVGTVPNAFSLINRLRLLIKRKKGTPLEDPTHINHFTVKELNDILLSRFAYVEIRGKGRLGWLAHTFPQSFAFGLYFTAKNPKKS